MDKPKKWVEIITEDMRVYEIDKDMVRDREAKDISS